MKSNLFALIFVIFVFNSLVTLVHAQEGQPHETKREEENNPESKTDPSEQNNKEANGNADQGGGNDGPASGTSGGTGEESDDPQPNQSKYGDEETIEGSNRGEEQEGGGSGAPESTGEAGKEESDPANDNNQQQNPDEESDPGEDHDENETEDEDNKRNSHPVHLWPIRAYTPNVEIKDSKVPFSTTELGFTLSCVPTKAVREYCADLAKNVGQDHLHYVELLKDDGLLKSYCVSDLTVMSEHIKHRCFYWYCLEDGCHAVNVFDITAAEGAGSNEKCRSFAFLYDESGIQHPEHGQSDCDGETDEPTETTKCLSNHGKPIGEEKAKWNDKEDIETLCDVRDD